MKNIISLSFFSIFFLIAAHANAAAQAIGGSIGSGTVSRGSSARGVVTMAIPDGLHVNSNKPKNEYSIPTVVRVIGTGVRIGAVNYPKGRDKKFAFSESTINVYEGRVSFPFAVAIPANFKRDTVRIRALVKYQACTDEVCYPPKTKEISMTARVR